MSTSSPADRTRALTTREREAIVALLERGTSSIRTLPITTADRARWLSQVPHTLAGRSCGCGICPSIELTDAEGHTPATVDGRVVLQAEAPGALLMLFVEEDRLSYLELAPLAGDSIKVFPASTDISTDISTW
ncbi:hypothetical protein [Kineococcus aurantiacus]|uniref:Uncharacterized protein n=1 Tax=Kineococcus aurantiacus TaxID=37633 RepID=A0A7Y9J2Z0_9ACTN|nr:hypothetical protein [Kineococcus aurantiacus]NYD24684.1 hypothetical protein [Kineococcus aurantiacus]